MKIKDEIGYESFKNLKPGTPFYYQGSLFIKTTCGLNYEPYNAVLLENGTCVWLGKDTEVKIARVCIVKDED